MRYAPRRFACIAALAMPRIVRDVLGAAEPVLSPALYILFAVLYLWEAFLLWESCVGVAGWESVCLSKAASVYGNTVMT